MNDVIAVILAGGSGTRFWPLSRRKTPKQLLALNGNRSLLQQTCERILPLAGPEQTLVITGLDQAQAVCGQLPQTPPSQVLAEPCARNTAAACGLAALKALAMSRDPLNLVLPADHIITNESLFTATLSKALQTASKQDVLVTLGLTPTCPATGFGYVEAGQLLDPDAPAVSRVKSFREKPDLPTAQAYVDSQNYFWNSGMFAWRARVLLAEIKQYLPDLAAGLESLQPYLGGPQEAQALADIYPQLPSISIDYGILEKCPDLRVVRADFGWSDLGSWDAMEDIWPQDQQGNCSSQGQMLALQAQGNVVYAPNRLAALLGVNDLVTVVTDDVLLVMPKQRSQDVRQIVDELQKRGWEKYL